MFNGVWSSRLLLFVTRQRPKTLDGPWTGQPRPTPRVYYVTTSTTLPDVAPSSTEEVRVSHRQPFGVKVPCTRRCTAGMLCRRSEEVSLSHGSYLQRKERLDQNLHRRVVQRDKTSPVTQSLRSGASSPLLIRFRTYGLSLQWPR